jgi:hypothetical protein
VVGGQAKAVEDVQPGDQVAAKDPETGANQAEAVADTYVRDAAPTITVATDAGEVTTTANHPFWEETGQTWTPAGQLEPGDRLLTADGRTVAVNSVAVTGRVETVHNFQFERLHNYYVAAGNTTILVHNTNGDACDMTAVRSAGQQGEAAAGIVPNTTRISIPNTSRYRVPDELTDTVIGEVKNVRYQHLSHQLNDYLTFAKANRLQFNLYVRPSTRLSKPLQKLVDQKRIVLIRIPNLEK